MARICTFPESQGMARILSRMAYTVLVLSLGCPTYTHITGCAAMTLHNAVVQVSRNEGHRRGS